MDTYIKPGTPCDLTRHTRTIARRSAFIQAHLTTDKVDHILDIGSGHGIYLDLISKSTQFCVELDINKEYLRTTKKTPNTECIQASAEVLPFYDNCFDYITMIETLEHIPHDQTAIAECYRVLKPHGCLIITAPNKFFPFETHVCKIRSNLFDSIGMGIPLLPYLPEMMRKHITSVRVYTPMTLRRMLNNAGFTVTVEEFLSPNLDGLASASQIITNYMEAITSCLQLIERNKVLRQFLTTIIILAEKPR